MQVRIALPVLLLFTASCFILPPGEEGPEKAVPKPKPTATAGETQKPPPEPPPVDGTYYPPPPEEPAQTAGVNGPLPDALCGAGGYYSISAITPSPLEPLPENAVVTVTATVNYALEYSDLVQLEAFSFNTYNSTLSEAVALDAGCGSVEITFSFATTGETQLIVGIQTYDSASVATFVTYDIGQVPRVRIDATSIPTGAYIAATSATITLSLSYETLGHDVFAMLYNGADYVPLELSGTSGTLEADVFLESEFCNQEVFASVELYDATDDRYYYRVVSWYLGPTLLISGVSAVNAGTSERQPILIQNCSGAALSGTVSADTTWLIPELTVLAVASHSEVENWFTVDATGLEPGEHKGHIIASADGMSASHEITLAVVDSYRFRADPVTYAWDTSADASKGTALFYTGADEGSTTLTLPFSVTTFGAPATTLYVYVNGVVSLDSVGAWYYQDAPSAEFTRTIYVNFADLMIGDTSQSIRYAITGEAPNRRFVLSFNDVQLYWDDLSRQTFQVILYEGQATFRVQYGAVDWFEVTGIGDGATIFTEWPAASNTAFDVTPL